MLAKHVDSDCGRREGTEIERPRSQQSAHVGISSSVWIIGAASASFRIWARMRNGAGWNFRPGFIIGSGVTRTSVSRASYAHPVWFDEIMPFSFM